ncbi:MAG: DUF4124 domain-containing protein [Rhodocyclaceae bacterium]|nr:DUF4124 domain-containing protein [Rhodocyclaceae bacterium]MCB1963580.1 DUF4124 domain-containing protein [Rhodocyclaceae bacterium]
MKPLCALLLCAAANAAYADVYKCVETDPATGQRRVTYTNAKSAPGCERLSRDLPVSSVPGMAPRAPAPAASGGGFPRVSDTDQQRRDTERRKILEAELSAEEKSLESARKALASEDAVRYGNERNYQKKIDRLKPFQDKVELHERNVDALKRELSNLR